MRRALLIAAAFGAALCLLPSGGNAASGLGFGPPGYTRTALDPLGGMYDGVAIGADGLPLLSYDGFRALKSAHCSNPACTSFTTATLETCGVGCLPHTSIAIGSDGLGLIAYAGASVEFLKVAHCTDPACSSATISTLGQPEHSAFGITSIAIGTDGLGLIAFIEPKGLVPKVAHCSNLTCSEATITNIDPSAFVFRDGVSVAIGTDGLPLVSYQSFGIKVAHCSNVACTASTKATLEKGDLGDWNSLTIGSDGLGLISYFDREAGGSLRVAHCSNTLCSSATTSAVEAGGIGGFTSITTGADGLGLISYEMPQTGFGPLKVAHCSNLACSSARVSRVDPDGNLFGTSVVIGADGLPLVTYYNQQRGLVAAHCANVLCVPFYGSR